MPAQRPPSRRSSGSELRVANGVLEPKAIGEASASARSQNAEAGPSSPKAAASPPPRRSYGAAMRRRSSVSSTLPGGRLNFVKFETDRLDECIAFIRDLIESSARANNVTLEAMKRSVKLMATGGGAHMHYQQLQDELGVEVRREEEMDCLITGLSFITEIPDEVFWYSDELVDGEHAGAPGLPKLRSIGLTASPSRETMNASMGMSIHSGGSDRDSSPTDSPPAAPERPEPTFERPSPNPPQYSVVFESHPAPQFPCMLVNIGSGVSIVKVTDYGQFERISGTSLGGGTLWGLLSLLTGAQTFDGACKAGLVELTRAEMLALSEAGDNESVDMLVGDICASMPSVRD